MDGAEEFEPNPKNPPKKAEVAEGEEGQEADLLFEIKTDLRQLIGLFDSIFFEIGLFYLIL